MILQYRQPPGDVEPAEIWQLRDIPRLQAIIEAAGHFADVESIRQAWCEWSEASFCCSWAELYSFFGETPEADESILASLMEYLRPIQPAHESGR